MYCLGDGIKIDKAKAAYWVEQAYNNGNEDANEVWEKYELWKYKK